MAVAALLVWADTVPAQTLPGLWGSPFYQVHLTVAGRTVTGSFTPLADEKAPPGTLTGQLRADGKAFTAKWSLPAGPHAATFSTWLTFSAKGEVLRGYRWSDETEPAAFSLRRAVDGAVPTLVVPEDEPAPPGAGTPPAGEAPARYTLRRVGPGDGDGDARQQTCRGNLHALSLAMLMYAQDHDGRLPDASRWTDEIAPFVPDDKSFQCPAAAGVPHGYAMNAALSKGLLSDIAQPSETVLLFESDLGKRNASGAPDGSAGRARHQGGGLCVCADGFVGQWTLQDPKPTAPGAALGGFLSGFSQSDGQR